MVILTLLAYGCYKEKQKEEVKTKVTNEKEEDVETEQVELDNIERELDQLKDDPDDFNYDYGDPESMGQIDLKFTDTIKEHLEIHEENQELSRSSRSSVKSKLVTFRKQEKRLSPQKLPYKIQPYIRPPPAHYQPPFDQRQYSKEPRYHHQGYHHRYQPYPDHHRPYSSQEPPHYDYYYHNNNNY